MNVAIRCFLVWVFSVFFSSILYASSSPYLDDRSILIHRYDQSEGDTNQVLLAEFYKAFHEDGKRPVILFLGGGGFQHQELGKSKAIADFFANNGFHVLSLRYRVGWLPNSTLDFCNGTPEGLAEIIFKEVMDVSIAMKFIHEHEDEFNFDASRIFIVGASAGAVIGLNYTYMGEFVLKWVREKNEKLPDSDEILNNLINRYKPRGVISMGGFLLLGEGYQPESIPLFQVSYTHDLLIHNNIGSFANCKELPFKNVLVYGPEYMFNHAVEWGFSVDWIAIDEEGHGLMNYVNNEDISSGFINFLNKYSSSEIEANELQWNKFLIK